MSRLVREKLLCFMKQVLFGVLLTLLAYQGVYASEKSTDRADDITYSCAREAGIETGPGKAMTPEQMAKFTACADRRMAQIKQRK